MSELAATEAIWESVLWNKLVWSDVTNGVTVEIMTDDTMDRSCLLSVSKRRIMIKLAIRIGMNIISDHSLKYKIKRAMLGRRNAKLQNE